MHTLDIKTPVVEICYTTPRKLNAQEIEHLYVLADIFAEDAQQYLNMGDGHGYHAPRRINP